MKNTPKYIVKPVTPDYLFNLLAFLFVIFIIILLLTPYSKKVSAMGVVTSSAGISKVYSKFPAIVEEIKITNGMDVSEGDILYNLRKIGAATQDPVAIEKNIDNLKKRESEIHQQLKSRLEIYNAKLKQLNIDQENIEKKS